MVATPPKPSGAAGSAFSLRVWVSDAKIKVAERQPGGRLPISCPERHINHDSSFCVGLDAGGKVTDEKSANQWWAHLQEYLQCQEFATKHRRWPPGKQLSHGNAAKYQLNAEKFADRLGLSQAYRDAVEHKVGWLSGVLPKVSKTEKKLLNGRARCPKDCKTKRGAPILRRQCREPENMWGLIANETMRRAEETRFIQSYQRDSMRCCGTMEICPFRR